jgi:hypothetical protein
MNHELRRSNFGEVLSGSGGGCATIATVLLLGGIGFATSWDVMFVGFCALVTLIFVALWLRRIEIAYDLTTGMVRVSRRFWPLPGTAVLEVPHVEIVAFEILTEDDGDGGTTQRYGLRLKDGSVKHVSTTGSNALGYDVAVEVNRMLGC